MPAGPATVGISAAALAKRSIVVSSIAASDENDGGRAIRSTAAQGE